MIVGLSVRTRLALPLKHDRPLIDIRHPVVVMRHPLASGQESVVGQRRLNPIAPIIGQVRIDSQILDRRSEPGQELRHFLRPGYAKEQEVGRRDPVLQAEPGQLLRDPERLVMHLAQTPRRQRLVGQRHRQQSEHGRGDARPLIVILEAAYETGRTYQAA
jgi:hypothetical protein